MRIPSPRTAFWIALLIATWSGQANVVVQLWTWSGLQALSSPQFADTHPLVLRAAATITHLGIYLAILAGVRRIVSPRSQSAESLTVLGTSVVYSCAVVGVTVLLMIGGGLP